MLDDDKKYIPYIPSAKDDGSESKDTNSKGAYYERKKPKNTFQTTSHKSVAETTVIIALIIGALMTPLALWIAIPYPSPQIEDFFRDQHTGAIKLTIDRRADSELYSILENALLMTTGQGLEAISEAEAVEVLMDTCEEDMELEPIRANFIISSDTLEDQIVFRAMSHEGGSKLPQLSWDLATMKMDETSVKELGPAKLMNLNHETDGKERPKIVETWFQGNYIVGNLGESLEQTIDTIDSDSVCSNSGNTYLIQNWPYGSEAPLIAIIENKNNCLSRFAESILNNLNYTFPNEKEETEEANSKDFKHIDETNTELPSKGLKNLKNNKESIRKQKIRAYIDSISSSLAAIEGISIEAFYNKNDNIELPLICKLRENSNIENVQEDISGFISKISDSTNNGLKLWEEMISERDYVANVELNLSETVDLPGNFPEPNITPISGGLSVSAKKRSDYYSTTTYKKPVVYRQAVKKKRYVPVATKVTSNSTRTSSRRQYSRNSSSSKKSSKKKSSSGGRISGTKAARRKYSVRSSSSSRKTNRNTYRTTTYRRRSG